MQTSSHGDRCRLHSAAAGHLFVPLMISNYGDLSFADNGPTVWNGLPGALRLDMYAFHTRLKTFLMT